MLYARRTRRMPYNMHHIPHVVCRMQSFFLYASRRNPVFILYLSCLPLVTVCRTLHAKMFVCCMSYAYAVFVCRIYAACRKWLYSVYRMWSCLYTAVCRMPYTVYHMRRMRHIAVCRLSLCLMPRCRCCVRYAECYICCMAYAVCRMHAKPYVCRMPYAVCCMPYAVSREYLST
jgi:hypothetical protein